MVAKLGRDDMVVMMVAAHGHRGEVSARRNVLE